MGMSLDMNNEQRDKLVSDLAIAMKSGEEAQMAAAFSAFSEYVQQHIVNDQAVLAANANADATALAARGYRQLTSAEVKYYEGLENAFKSTDVKMALQNIEVAMPETVLDSVFDDIKQKHPLLDLIGFQNTHGAIKMLANVGGIAPAAWGKLTDKKKAEITGSLTEVDAQLLKLIAYIPVPKSMIDLGPVWLDSYVRTMLAESLAMGMEIGVVSGDGDETPVGMDKKVGKNATISNKKYAKKTAIKVKKFDRNTYGKLLSKMAVNSENGLSRDIDEVVLIVNPADYFSVVMPCTSMLTSDGRYVRDVFPFPTKVVKSCAVEAGSAIIGIADRYMLCAGMSKGGKLEFDDSVQFLDDNRVYLIKMYCNGLPLDDNAFLLLNIQDLEEVRFPVTTWVEAPEADAPTTNG